MGKGKVYLIGAGPGKPDLITVRGQKILCTADVVVYDYLVDQRILKNVNKSAECISCQSSSHHKTHRADLNRQENINQLLVKKAREGKMVVRLKGGDPAIFSRCLYELEALAKAKIEFEVVPGITAASAASAFCGMPLTDGRIASDCIFVTGHENISKEKSFVHWDALAKVGTIVFYMGVGNLKKITTRLIKAGKDKKTPVTVIQDASLPKQRNIVGSLANIVALAKKNHIEPPAIIVVGDMAKYSNQFNWLKKNKRTLFTGLSAEDFHLKGTRDHIPLIEIRACEDYKEFDGYLKSISSFDWIVFTSRFAVEYFFKRLKVVGFDIRKLAGINVAVIGEVTKNKLQQYAILADLVPKKESSAGLIADFKKIDLKGKKIFLPRSSLSDKGLVKALEKRGASVTASVAYTNVMPDDLPDLDLNVYQEIVFTSPSTVRNFKKRYGTPPKNVTIKCIGNVTLKEAKRCRFVAQK